MLKIFTFFFIIFLSVACIPLNQNLVRTIEGAEVILTVQDSFPKSKNSLSTQPFLKGTVSEYITDIYFYKNSSCSGSQTNLTSNPLFLSDNGIKVLLENENYVSINKKYEISAKIVFKSGVTRCHGKIFEYETSSSDPVEFASVFPTNPSSQKAPQFKGLVDANELKNFKFFSDSSCLQSLNNTYISDTSFKNGFSLNLEENKNNSIYVKPYLSSSYNYTAAGPCRLFTNYTVDTINPTLSITTLASVKVNKTNYTNFQVTGTCSDIGRNVVITPNTGITLVNSPLTVTCAPGNAWTANLNFTGSSGSSVGIKVNHSDAAGNTATEATQTFTTFDILDPVVTLTSPSIINNSNKGAYSLSGTCTNGDGSVSVSIDDSDATTLASSKTGINCSAGKWNIVTSDAFSVTQLNDGVLTMTASQTDSAGNTGSKTQNVTKNTVTPNVTLSTPLTPINNSNKNSYSLSGTCSNGDNNISGNLSDGINTLNFSTIPCASGSWTQNNLNTSSLNEGNISVTVNQSNSAGNTGSKTESVIKDITPPTQPIISNKYYFDSSTQSPTITWASTDSGSGIKNFSYFIGSFLEGTDKINSTQIAVNSVQATLNTGTFDEGSTYYISVKAADQVGNESSTGTSTWIKKATPPVLAILSPTESAILNATTLNLSGSCNSLNNISFSITPASSANPLSTALCVEDQFNAQTQIISETDLEITITATQNDGTSDQIVTRKINYSAPILKSISANRQHSCGIKNGISYCWGNNSKSRLGDGTTTLASSPVKVSLTNLDPTSTEFKQITNGAEHSCALSNDKIAYCWGNNGSGQLGDGTGINSQKPIKVDMSSVEGGTFMQISAGEFFSCGLSESKKVYCWGSNTNKALGNSPEAIAPGTDTLKKPALVTISEDIKQISLGGYTACALSSKNNIWCWGYNYYIYGNGLIDSTPTQSSFEASLTPAGENQAGETFKLVSVGAYNACALSSLDDIFCWGYKQQGILGVNTALSYFNHPYKRISSFKDKNGNLVSGIKFKKISLGSRSHNFDDVTQEGKIAGDPGTASANPRYVHACAISTDNKVYCWGSNNLGQLGINKSSAQLAFSETPTEIYLTGDNTDIAFTDVSTGIFHTCAIGTKNGEEKIFCWGSYQNGKLGLGADIVTQAQPVLVPTEVTSWPNP